MNKKPTYSMQQILNYLKNKLGNKDRYELEKDIAKDPFLSDAMDGFSTIDANELEKDFNKLSGRLQQKTKPSINLKPLYKIAATVALFLTLGSITYFYVFPNLYPEKITEQHSKTDKQPLNEPRALKEASEISIPIDSVTIKQNTKTVDLEGNINAKKSTKSFSSGTKKSDNKKINKETMPIASEETQTIASGEKETPNENIAIAQTIDNNQMPEIVEELKDESELTDKEAFYITEQTVAPASAERKDKMNVSAAKPSSKNEASSRNISKLHRRNISKKTSMEAELALENSNIVTGTILVEYGNKPYPGIHILTYSEQSQTYTDENGHFELSMNEDSIVIINFDKLPPIEININKDPLPILITLKTIEITFSADINKHAEPENGIDNLKNYILEKKSKRTGNPHPVTVECTINEKGNFISFIIEGNKDDIFANQLIRLLKEGPKWTPAINEGKNIEDKFSITVIF